MLIKLKNIFLFIFIFLLVITSKSSANPHRYLIGSKLSSIRCSVHYLVVPKIEGHFKDFTGVIYYDQKDITKSSVLMKVKTESIETGNKTWDKIIRSNRVLDAYKFPLMTFKSSSVIGTKEKLSVDGLLDLHGVIKNKLFPFSVEGPFEDDRGEFIKVKGKWVINRKEFNVIWHKVLDKGGVIVGNNVVVDWEIIAYRD